MKRVSVLKVRRYESEKGTCKKEKHNNNNNKNKSWKRMFATKGNGEYLKEEEEEGLMSEGN